MVAADQTRALRPGSSGWSAADLRDPDIERQWDANHYEMIRGVIAEMPPAAFDHGYCASKLLDLVERHLEAQGVRSFKSYEVDACLDEDTVMKIDAVLLVADDERRQAAAWRKMRKSSLTVGRLLVPPTLAVESISMGHEARDRSHKHSEYERFGIPNYWIVDAMRRTLTCFRLIAGRYQLDAQGKDRNVIRPTAFPGLSIPLKDVFR